MKLKELYQKKVVPEMQKEFIYKNKFEVPAIEKVTVNIGTGKFLKDSNNLEEIKDFLRIITGQNPVATKAKISIAGFKIREGMEVGYKVTLRGKRMWDFLERMVKVALPRVRDFRGIKRSSIGQAGNINIGIKEHLVFPEIIPENVKNIYGFQVTISTGAKTREVGEKLFELMGFPLEQKNN